MADIRRYPLTRHLRGTATMHVRHMRGGSVVHEVRVDARPWREALRGDVQRLEQVRLAGPVGPERDDKTRSQR